MGGFRYQGEDEVLGNIINEKTYVCWGVVEMFVNPRLDNAVEFEVRLYTIPLVIENEGVVENMAGTKISDVCVVVNTPVKVLFPLKEEYDVRAVFRRVIVSIFKVAFDIAVFIPAVVVYGITTFPMALVIPTVVVYGITTFPMALVIPVVVVYDESAVFRRVIVSIFIVAFDIAVFIPVVFV